MIKLLIGIVVKVGVLKLDISIVDVVKCVLLVVKIIVYFDSVSGVYVFIEMFDKFGIVEVMKDKVCKILVMLVGEIVVYGEVEFGL